ncbi:hypothetical protein [Ketobacter sp.]
MSATRAHRPYQLTGGNIAHGFLRGGKLLGGGIVITARRQKDGKKQAWEIAHRNLHKLSGC